MVEILRDRPALGDFADPRMPQKRIATTPSGRQVFVEITSEDRLRLVGMLEGRWKTVIKQRESGRSIEEIARWAKVPCNPEHECRGHCEPRCLRCYIAEIYTWMETALHDIAQTRAKLMI